MKFQLMETLFVTLNSGSLTLFLHKGSSSQVYLNPLQTKERRGLKSVILVSENRRDLLPDHQSSTRKEGVTLHGPSILDSPSDSERICSPCSAHTTAHRQRQFIVPLLWPGVGTVIVRVGIRFPFRSIRSDRVEVRHSQNNGVNRCQSVQTALACCTIKIFACSGEYKEI